MASKETHTSQGGAKDDHISIAQETEEEEDFDLIVANLSQTDDQEDKLLPAENFEQNASEDPVSELKTPRKIASKERPSSSPKTPQHTPPKSSQKTGWRSQKTPSKSVSKKAPRKSSKALSMVKSSKKRLHQDDGSHEETKPKRQKQEGGSVEEDKNDDGWEDVADDTEDIDEALEEKADKIRMNAKNVKSVIHHVLTNEHVLNMFKDVLEAEKAETSPEKAGSLKKSFTPEKLDCVPKWTRAKVKDFLERLSVPSPVKTTKDGPSILDVEFTEEEDDDEYNPEKEPPESDDDDESVTSSRLSDIGSPFPATPTTPVVRPEPAITPSEIETPQSTQPENYASTSSAPRNLEAAFTTCVETPTQEGKNRVDNIALRTRSKLPLTSTSITDIESAFVAPDITEDLYDTNVKDDDWVQFLSSLYKPTDDVVNDDDGDANDPEFNYIAEAEQEMLDEEDFRFDKPTQITKKELNSLINELSDLFEEDEVLPHEVVARAPEIKVSTTEQPMAEVAMPPSSIVFTDFKAPQAPSQQTMSRTVNMQQTSGVSTLKTRPKTYGTHSQSSRGKYNSSHSQCHNTQEPNEDLVTPEQRALIEDHMRKHIQLLAQSFILFPREKFGGECQDGSQLFLTELDHFRQTSAKGEDSVYNVCNLDPALEVLSHPELTNPILLNGNDTRKYIDSLVGKGEFPKTVSMAQKVAMYNSAACVYPRLLPTLLKARKNEQKYAKFLHSEENLIALGLEQFQYCQNVKPLELIYQLLIRCKTPAQIQWRIKFLCSSKGRPNAVRTVKKKGVLPPDFPRAELEVFYPKPPKEQNQDLLPYWCRGVTDSKLRAIASKINYNLQQTETYPGPNTSCQTGSGNKVAIPSVRSQGLSMTGAFSENTSSPALVLPSSLPQISGIFIKFGKSGQPMGSVPVLAEDPGIESQQKLPISYAIAPAYSDSINKTSSFPPAENSQSNAVATEGTSQHPNDIFQADSGTSPVSCIVTPTMEPASPDLLAKTMMSCGIEESPISRPPGSPIPSPNATSPTMPFTTSTPDRVNLVVKNKHASVRNLYSEFNAAHQHSPGDSSVALSDSTLNPPNTTAAEPDDLRLDSIKATKTHAKTTPTPVSLLDIPGSEFKDSAARAGSDHEESIMIFDPGDEGTSPLINSPGLEANMVSASKDNQKSRTENPLPNFSQQSSSPSSSPAGSKTPVFPHNETFVLTDSSCTGFSDRFESPQKSEQENRTTDTLKGTHKTQLETDSSLSSQLKEIKQEDDISPFSNSKISAVAKEKIPSTSPVLFDSSPITIRDMLEATSTTESSDSSRMNSPVKTPPSKIGRLEKTPTKLRPLAPKLMSPLQSKSPVYVPLPKISPKRKELNKQVRHILPKSFFFEAKAPSPTKAAALVLKKKATMVYQHRSPIKILPKQSQSDSSGHVRPRALFPPSRMFTRSQRTKTRNTGKINVSDEKKLKGKSPPKEQEKDIDESETSEVEDSAFSQEEEEEEDEDFDGCDNQMQLDDLMAACTTIRYDPKKGSGQECDNKSKAKKKKELCLAMLEPDILECDPKKDERDIAYAQHYFNRVKEVLQQDTERFRNFLTILHDLNKDHSNPIELYVDIVSLLSDHQDLVDDFAGFLLSFQAMECKCFVSSLEYQQIRNFLRQLEIYCDTSSMTFQKTLKMMSQWLTLNHEAQTETISFKERMGAVLRHVPDVMDDLVSYFLDGPFPDSHPDDFEDVNLDEEDINHVDEFEEVTLPEGREDYNTKLCSCQCHQDQQDERLRRRIKHCFSCSLKMYEGKPVLKIARNEFRPLSVVYPLEEKEKRAKAKKEAALIALAKARAQRQQQRKKNKLKKEAKLKAKKAKIKKIPLKKKFRKMKSSQTGSRPFRLDAISKASALAAKRNLEEDSVSDLLSKELCVNLDTVKQEIVSENMPVTRNQTTSLRLREMNAIPVSNEMSDTKPCVPEKALSYRSDLATTSKSFATSSCQESDQLPRAISDASKGATKSKVDVSLAEPSAAPTSTAINSHASSLSQTPSTAITTSTCLNQSVAKDSQVKKSQSLTIKSSQSKMSQSKQSHAQSESVSTPHQSQAAFALVSTTACSLGSSPVMNTPQVSFSSPRSHSVRTETNPLTLAPMGLQQRLATSVISTIRIPVMVTLKPQRMPPPDFAKPKEVSPKRKKSSDSKSSISKTPPKAFVNIEDMKSIGGQSNINVMIQQKNEEDQSGDKQDTGKNAVLTDSIQDMVFAQSTMPATVSSGCQKETINHPANFSSTGESVNSNITSINPDAKIQSISNTVPQNLKAISSPHKDNTVDGQLQTELSSVNLPTSASENVSDTFHKAQSGADNSANGDKIDNISFAMPSSLSSPHKRSNPNPELLSSESLTNFSPSKFMGKIPGKVVRAHLENFSLGAFGESVDMQLVQQLAQSISPSKGVGDSLSKFDLMAAIESSNLTARDATSHFTRTTTESTFSDRVSFSGALSSEGITSHLSFSGILPSNKQPQEYADESTEDQQQGLQKSQHNIEKADVECPTEQQLSRPSLEDEGKDDSMDVEFEPGSIRSTAVTSDAEQWTEEEDKCILTMMNDEDITEISIKKIQPHLPTRSFEEINSRAQQLLSWLQDMDSESDAGTEASFDE